MYSANTATRPASPHEFDTGRIELQATNYKLQTVEDWSSYIIIGNNKLNCNNLNLNKTTVNYLFEPKHRVVLSINSRVGDEL